MQNIFYEIIKTVDPNRIFVTDDIEKKDYSYAEFFSRALSLGDYIIERIEGDSIIAVKENSFDLALLYFSIMLTDKRIVVIDPQKGNEEIKCLLDEIDSTGIFYDSEDILALSEKHFGITFPCLINIDKYEIDSIQKVAERASLRNMNAPYLVTFTSGTSGITKGVEHSLNNLFLTAIALDEKVNKRGGSFLHVMPMTYMAGILNSLIYPFVIGSRIVITKRFSIISARSFWDTVTHYSIDLFWLSPSMLMIVDQLDRKNDGESYCRENNPIFLVGTAPLSYELRQRFNSRYGVKVYAGYGLSETLFISIETKESIERSNKNCVGELLNNVSFRISDAGEMQIDVPWMYLRYINEDTEKYFDGKYYKTGDIVRIDDGYLYITGRSKDLIIKGGMNISPTLIEDVVNRDERILESTTIGVNDKCGEEKVCCAYVLKDKSLDVRGLESGLKKSVIERLGINYAIDYMFRLDQMPRNINGKIDRNIVKQMWEINNAT